MPDIQRMISNVKALNVREVVREALSKSTEPLVREQQSQMLRGETAEPGKKIGKYKNKSYRRKKFNMNVLAGYGNVDLKLTGQFHLGIKVYFFTESFFFKSTDWKNEILTKKYGEDIYGLNPKSVTNFNKGKFREIAAMEFRKVLGK